MSTRKIFEVLGYCGDSSTYVIADPEEDEDKEKLDLIETQYNIISEDEPEFSVSEDWLEDQLCAELRDESHLDEKKEYPFLSFFCEREEIPMTEENKLNILRRFFLNNNYYEPNLETLARWCREDLKIAEEYRRERELSNLA